MAMPMQLNMGMSMDPSSYPELNGGGCKEHCQALLCPCYAFGRVVGQLKQARGIDQTACCSWATFLLVCWGGTVAGANLLTGMVGGEVAKYGAYGLYALLYLEYIYPYLQAAYMYKSVKSAVQGASDGMYSEGMALRINFTPTETSMSCMRWGMFLCCPCSYLASVDHVVNEQNRTQSILAMDPHETVCPFKFTSDYKVRIQAPNGVAQAAASQQQQQVGGAVPISTPNVDAGGAPNMVGGNAGGYGVGYGGYSQGGYPQGGYGGGYGGYGGGYPPGGYGGYGPIGVVPRSVW